MEDLYKEFKEYLSNPDELNIAKIENILSGRRGDDFCNFIKEKKTDLNPIKSVLTRLYEKMQSAKSSTTSSRAKRKGANKRAKREAKQQDNSKEIDNLELLLLTLHIYGFELGDDEFLKGKKFSPRLTSIVGAQYVKDGKRNNSDREINFSLVLNYLKDGKLARARKEIEENNAPKDHEKSKSDRDNICLFTLRRGLSHKKYSMLDAIKGDEFLYARGQALGYLAANASYATMDKLITNYIEDNSYKFRLEDLNMIRSLRNCRNYNPMFQALIKKGIKGITVVSEGINPNNDTNQDSILSDMLIAACEHNNIECVVALLEKGADPTICDKFKRSALTIASYHANVGILEKLSEHTKQKAWLEHKDEEGYTMIAAACEHRRVETVKYLLNKEANPRICNNERESALTIAASKDDVALLEALLEALLTDNPDLIDSQDDLGYTMIAVACESGRVGNVKYLLKKEANPRICNNEGESALTIAASNDNVELLKTLLKDNPDIIYSQDDPGYTMIAVACESGRVENVKYLLKQGANPRICNNKGKSALTIAASKDNVALLETLLAHTNSEINHKDKQGLTMITSACANGRVENVKYLLKQGADPRICNNEGESALTIAASKDDVALLEALKFLNSIVPHPTTQPTSSEPANENERQSQH